MLNISQRQMSGYSFSRGFGVSDRRLFVEMRGTEAARTGCLSKQPGQDRAGPWHALVSEICVVVCERGRAS